MKWKKRLKMLRVSTIAIAVCLILLTIFAGFTIYGNKIGNFVVQVGGTDEVVLSLNNTEDPINETSRLVVGGLDWQDHSTFKYIPNEVSQGLGSKSDEKQHLYFAYSFYLINKSPFAVDYDVTLDVVDTVGDPLPMLRVMIIEGDAPKTEGNIFALPEADEEAKRHLEADLANYTPYTTTDFLSTLQLVDERSLALRKGEQVKYTVVFWLEGCDIDCNNSRLGDRVRMEMTFHGRKKDIEE